MQKLPKNIMNYVTSLLLVLCYPSVGIAVVQAVSPSDFVILQSLGEYHSSGKGKCGNGAGVLAAAQHFKTDHADMTCRTGYYNVSQDLAVSVQVTQHSSSDSDKWLLHELDHEFRNYYGIPGYYIKTINGNTVYVYGAGGRDYRWLSGNKVIKIEYFDSQLTKPEPIEVIQAYLAKHPSTLPPITMNDLNGRPNKTTWIKDEMDRRLWLCVKWFAQLELGKVQQSDVIRNVIKSIIVVLDYREKYYGSKSTDEKNLLAGYMEQNNSTAIKTKLDEYKSWWTAHKADSISL